MRRAEWLSKHSGLVISGVTAYAYFLGYASVSVFAGGLGITVRDLGLDFRDYLMLAAVNAISSLAPLATYYGLLELTTYLRVRGLISRREDLLIGLPVAVATTALLAIAGGVAFGWDEPGAVRAFAIIFTIAFWLMIPASRLSHRLYMRRRWRTTTDLELLQKPWPRWRFAACAVGMIWLISSAVVTLVGCHMWSEAIEDAASRGESAPSGPLALSLALHPERGIASVSTEGRFDGICLTRISDRVFVGDEVTWVRDVDAFRTAQCVPE
jgi:hypothetical protein